MKVWACIFGLMLAALSWSRGEDISRGWKFRLGESGPWATVNLPHTWNVADGADGGTYHRGVGWYTRDLNFKFDPARQDVYLRVGAASLSAQVSVNGEVVGEHRGGCAAFCFDISKWAHPGKNSLAIRVDNSLQKDIIPLSGDFTVYGGLYRDVQVLVLNKVCISPVDDGGPGLYVTARVSGSGENPPPRGGGSPSLARTGGGVLGSKEPRPRLVPRHPLPKERDSSSEGAIDTSIKVRNTGAPTEGDIKFELRDAAGKSVASIQTQGPIESGDHDAHFKLLIPKPHLWDGVRDPYFYTATATISVHGKVVDQVTQPVGFRTFSIDRDQGFILNGKPYDYHGVNLHQGRPSVGWAATQAMREQDYRLVKEIGATGVRLAHYQHAPQEYDLCDKYGFVTWAEIPLVDKMTDSPEFKANCAQQLRELIKQNYNHPAICLWSVYNEPRVERNVDDNKWLFVKDLVAQGHQMDPIRIMTGAASESPTWWLMWVQDHTAFNRYWGWYGGKATDWPTALDKMKQTAQGKPFGMSEYGAGASIAQHEWPPKQPVSTGHWHPEEYQAYFHEQSWSAMRDRPWVWCKLVWAMFDFPSDGRDEGDHPGINDKGLVTGDRKTKKDAFYYYQSQWTTKPMVHICSQRFNPRPAGKTVIKVYSNAGPMELFINGQSQGTRNVPEGIYEWPVELRPGVAVVEAKTRKASEKVTWTIN